MPLLREAEDKAGARTSMLVISQKWSSRNSSDFSRTTHTTRRGRDQDLAWYTAS